MLRQSSVANLQPRWKISALTRVWCAFNMPSVLAVGLAFLSGLGLLILMLALKRQFHISSWVVPIAIGGVIETVLILLSLREFLRSVSVLRHGVRARAKIMNVMEREIMHRADVAGENHYSYDYQLAFKDENGERRDTEFTSSISEIEGVAIGDFIDVIYDARDPEIVIVPAAMSSPLDFGEDGVIRPRVAIQPIGFLGIVLTIVCGWVVLCLMAFQVVTL